MNDSILVALVSQTDPHARGTDLPSDVLAGESAFAEIERRITDSTASVATLRRAPAPGRRVAAVAFLVVLAVGVGGYLLSRTASDVDVDAASPIEVVEAYFDAWREGNTDAMVAMFSPEMTTVEFCGGDCETTTGVPIAAFRIGTAWADAEGTTFGDPMCTAGPDAGTITCDYDLLPYSAAVVEKPPNRYHSTFGVAGGEITSHVIRIGSTGVLQRQFLDDWVREVHPEDLGVLSPNGWADEAAARAAGTRANELAYEWAVELSKRGCSYLDTECPVFEPRSQVETVIDRYFEAWRARDLELMMAVYETPTVGRTLSRIDFCAAPCDDPNTVGLDAYRVGLVRSFADGTVPGFETCTAPELDAIGDSWSTSCSFDMTTVAIRGLGLDPIPYRIDFRIQALFELAVVEQTVVIGPYSSDVDTRFRLWVEANHPDDVDVVDQVGWATEEEAVASGTLARHYAEEWVALLQAKGCDYRLPCP